MEKVIYALWKDPVEEDARFTARLLGDIAPRLGGLAHAVRVNVQDDSVRAGTSPRMTSTRPQMDAVVQLWLPSANDSERAAVDTQSNFEYVQNLIVRPLSYGAPAYVAMVEECFPAAALTDDAVYFDAADAPARLAENQQLMMESCARFIDFDRIDCIPTSQFDIRPFQR